ncbi:GNAT family N-acetyltransferase [Haladaptatus sp. DFWS20]|uniref:GNAT family N-acetyltransferase n=1 Tax=Haladaptatus sp. DFWS20 TaxID=3403467 RepID=UPI003EBF3965
MTDAISAWTIRRYRPGDKNAVWSVHDRSLRDSAMEYSPEYNRYLRRLDSTFLDRDGEFLVVTVDSAESLNDSEFSRTNDIVAIGGFQPVTVSNDPRAAIRQVLERDESTAHIRSVAVLPAAQSCGVGTALMDELERRAVKNGFSHVVLSTMTELERSQRFYDARGYDVVSMDDDETAGHIWYRKSLDLESFD